MIKNFFKDQDNKTVIAQTPNLIIIIWFSLKILEFINLGYANQFGLLANMALFTWGYLELTQGVNTFRKVLGFKFSVCTLRP